MSVYYSVRIPWSDTPTQWHPTSRTGPMSVLTRGAFKTKGEAIEWADKHLRGEPYDVATFDSGVEANMRKRTSRKSKRASRRPRRTSRRLRPNLHRTSSGKAIPRPTSVIYTERAKFPKWNIKPDAVQEPRLLKSRLRDWTAQDHKDAARWNAKMAQRLERAWAAELRGSEKKYGEHGPVISGGFRADWPEAAKDRARKLARAYSDFVGVSFAHAAQVRGMKDKYSHGGWRSVKNSRKRTSRRTR